MSGLVSMTSGLDFHVGDRVWYEVATRTGDDFRVPAVVRGLTRRRVIVEFRHWADGRKVRRRASVYRVEHRGALRRAA